ncbi:hypothetical protein HQ346_21875 [Rhodococcus sp. BP-252]|uniref:Uncharacterized protein n=1 Tax=Rhodococcoides kyotonense TaxID=398843 RepID=A0A177YDE5_9NOCA|nr:MULTISPECIES: hypothetical protein [Rhodococcus]MBY6412931.1 hypothetical protein [Rhodococcus sp. BP-320]MBY6419467.1 hypothetical protein [Rhodococcus sp. BP-321]MBY6423875.1 hypothetical protein [Rhodococcus sp. BP-324]MBY6429115.1 hypothetical protein [Rhodococcus sp. BP-323]MBY6432853.1 hypothetical protein [Rhodococcus sp. BP-322]
MNGVDQGRLRRLASESSVRDAHLGREIDLALDRCFARIRVQVSGRVGVGKSTVRAVVEAALSESVGFGDAVDITEAAAVDVPRSPDPILDGDVVVHVLAGGAQAADVEVLSSVATAVAVLAKADTLDDASDTVARSAATVGVPVLPLMATVARSLSRGEPSSFADLRCTAASLPDDAVLTPDRFALAAPDAETGRRRRVLVDQVEMAGVRLLVGILRNDPTVDDATLRLMLADASGVRPVLDAVGRCIDGIRTDREGRLLHRLTELCAEHPRVSEEIERYLATDEAVLAVMRSALRAVGEARDLGQPLAAAVEWHRRARSASNPDFCRAAVAISRGYLRVHAS